MDPKPEPPPDPNDLDLTRTTAGVSRSSLGFGPYRLLRQLGEGGMGQVWLAEQIQPLRRQVAIKVIKAGMDTARVIARFEAEREALAMMDHPAIARVFDAGSTPEGRPYFAMEYVRGEPVTAYCDRNRLTVDERLELFLQVCDGVQHAHQKAIIHRDLKPSNVLVTIQDDRPVPKIIDFGLAKATTVHLTDQRSFITEFGALVGTLEYMSPEQADMSGLDIDTRTDVYALGVMLYELLTGSLPFDAKTLRQQGLEEMRRTIREVEPLRPSSRMSEARSSSIALAQNRRTEPDRLRSKLRGDLDWITMLALEKDRVRRYQTANALAMDIRRSLSHEPVVAGPPSSRYRIGKFVRRHRTGVAVAGVLVALLVAFGAAMAVQSARIARERDRANLEAQAATAIADFVVGLFTVSDPSQARGNTVTAREILDQGAERIDALSHQPPLQARLQRTLGEVYTSLGLYALAGPLLERALSTHRRVLGAGHRETIDTLFALGEWQYYGRRYRDAEASYREAARLRRASFGPDARETLEAEMAVASACMQQNRFDEAERLFQSTLQRQQSTLGDEDPLTLNTINEMSVLYFSQGRYAEALPLNERVWQVQHRLFGETAPRTLISQGNLADNLARLTRYDESEQLYRTAIAGQERVLGVGHPVTQRTMKKFVAMYEAWGQPAKADEWRAKLTQQPASSP